MNAELTGLIKYDWTNLKKESVQIDFVDEISDSGQSYPIHVRGYDIDRKGTIWALGRDLETLLKFSRQGKLERKYNLIDPDVHEDYFFNVLYFSHLTVLGSDQIILPFFPNYPPSKVVEMFQYGPLLEVELDADSGGVVEKEIFGKYPAAYQNPDDYYHATGSTPAYCLNNSDEVILSFPIDHNLYVYDNAYHRKRIVPAKSKYIQSFEPFSGSLFEVTEGENYSIQQPIYSSILFDEYQNVYYRVALHRAELLDEEENNIEFTHKAWSILIFDGNFEKLGEHFFEPKTLNFQNIVVGPQGLLVANYDNLEDTTNETLNYSLFTLPKTVPHE